MIKNKPDESYYHGLHRKVMEFDYTIMSLVADEPESPKHSSYCFTIGLSNFGHPEVMFADCYYDDVTKAIEQVLKNIKSGKVLCANDKIVIEQTLQEIKAIELKDGVKEELTKQAFYYFEIFRKDRIDYDLLYLSLPDEFGYYPDEKVFSPTKHIQKQFYKSSISHNMSSKKIIMASPSSLYM